jgi:DNA invertase Pin-like site-specific DNA recombinase
MDRAEIDVIFASGSYSNFKMPETRALDLALVAQLQEAERSVIHARSRRRVALIQGDEAAFGVAAADVQSAERELERCQLRRQELNAAFDRERLTDRNFGHTKPEYYRHPV